MAETKKKKSGTAAGSSKKTTNENSKPRSSSRAKEEAQKIQAKRKADKRVVDEIWAIIIIAFGAFLVVATFTDGAGKLGEMIDGCIKGLFGFMGFVLPFLLIVFGILLFAKKTSHFSVKTLLLFLLVIFMLCTMYSIHYINSAEVAWSMDTIKGYYTAGQTLESGGFFGMIIAAVLVVWLGNTGSWIFSVVVTLVCLLLIINTPISRFFAKLGDKIEERKLIKQNAHLDEQDYAEETQLEMEQTRANWKAVNESKKAAKAEPVASAAKPAVAAPAIVENKPKKEIKIINSSVLENEEQVMPEPAITEPKDDYVPLSVISEQAAMLERGEKPGMNQVLAYMNDDSLFGRTSSDTVGLEEKRETGERFGVDGIPEMVGGIGLSGEGAVPYEDLGTPKPQEQVKVTYAATSYSGGVKTSADAPPDSSYVPGTNDMGSEKKQDKPVTGTPDKDVVKKISDKEARSAMLTTEELNKAPVVKTYKYPPISLLERNTNLAKSNNAVLKEKAELLEDTLKTFNVDASVVQVTQGPTVTRYEIQPAAGVKVSKIVSLADDIALHLRAKSIRIEAPIPGKAAVGIEIENDSSTMVRIREVIDTNEFRDAKSKISFALGKDISGTPIVSNLKSMPHMLIAGSTGSGKSVCINSIIISMLYKANPDEVKLILIDPKVVELGNYNGIPHLMIPVVTEPNKAAAALNWAVAEMEDRYKKFAEEGVRDLESYNEYVIANEEHEKVLPQIVIIIDELADLMMSAPTQIQESICRIAQKARAAGMHLIVATQRPSVDVITGVIKANVPSRIAFAVSSHVDSQTILDMKGAEKLVGKGDMLYYPMGMSKPIRVQGTFISDGEVNKVIDFVKDQALTDDNLQKEMLARINQTTQVASSDDDEDELLEEAIDLVVNAGQASVSMLQRRFRIGYNRAARIMDSLEGAGVVGVQDGARPRQVLLSPEQWEEKKYGVNENQE